MTRIYENEMRRDEYKTLSRRRIYNTKYYAKRTEYNGISFDSAKEARHYAELDLLQKAGEISDLQRQVKYELIPTQRDPETKKVIERPCSYYADFVYKDKNGETVVEDVKSKATQTPQYKIKRKLMLEKYGIRIREV